MCGRGPVRVEGKVVPDLTVLYDGNCTLCRSGAARVRRMDRGGRIELVDLHAPDAPARFPQVDREEAMRWMQAVDRAGRVYSGADAWARVGLALPGWKLIAGLLLAPGIHIVARHIYAWVARNRYRWNSEECVGGSCAAHTRQAHRSRGEPQ
jgi:predicted DCC family thiol-disulfide oxidoreductase YuxK